MSKRQAEIVFHHLHRLTAGPALEPDRHLLESFTTGRDKAAFATLLERHGAMVFRVCRRLLHDAHEAEDAFQATFLILARKAHTIRQQQSLTSWLYKVAYHVALRARAGATRRAAMPLGAPRPQAVDPLAEVSGRELLSILDEELQQLPEKYRAPLLLCYLEGHTQDEAARQLDWSPQVLRGRVERGRAVLRRRLLRRGFGLAVVLAGNLLDPLPTSAAVPALLIAQTIRAATSSAVEQASLVSAPVTALVASGVHLLGASRRRGIAFVLLLASLAAAGGGLAAFQTPAVKPPPAQANRPAQKEDQPAPPMRKPARDRLGDPLPVNVQVRLGTSRLRHGGWFTAMAYAPDGKTLATVAHDGTVRLWEAASGRALRVLGNERERRIPYAASRWLFCVAFSPDGKWLAAGEHVQDQAVGRLHIWNLATGKEERRYLAHPGGVHVVVFRPDSRMLASAGASDGKIRLWDPATGKELHVLGTGQSTNCLAFSPDGKTLASAGGQVIRLWDARDGTDQKQLRGHRDRITSIAFHPDSKMLASVDLDRTIRLWSVATGRQPCSWTAPGLIHSVAFSPDGKFLATGGSEPMVLWNAATGKEERRLRHPPGEVAALAFAPDGKTLATATTGERCLRLWDMQTGQEHPASAAGHHGSVGFVRFTPDGEALVSAGSEDLELFRWKIASGEQLWHSHLGRHEFARPVDLAADGKVLAAGTPTGAIRLVDALSGKELGHYLAHKAAVETVAFSPDGKTLASTGHDNTLCIGEVAAPRIQRSLPLDAVAPFVRFSPDSKILATAAPNGPIELREADNGRVRTRVVVQMGQICSLAYSPDSRRLAAGTTTGGIEIWDTGSGKRVCTLTGHTGFVFALAFSHDGKTLAAGGWMQLRLWETATAQERAHFTELEGDVFAADFAPGDRTVASGNGDGSILLWDLTGRPPKEDVRQAMTALLGDDAHAAYQAVWTLAATPRRSLPWLKERLRPVVGLDKTQLKALIRQLDDDKFAVRNAAMRDLTKVVEQAEPALHKALEGNPPLETRRRLELLLEPLTGSLPPPERVRQLRLLEVLERMGTKEAKEWLKKLTDGEPGVFLTRQAKASLDRLER
jgi:RNA polymerase sigma factor (sigma-70 family)